MVCRHGEWGRDTLKSIVPWHYSQMKRMLFFGFDYSCSGDSATQICILNVVQIKKKIDWTSHYKYCNFSLKKYLESTR